MVLRQNKVRRRRVKAHRVAIPAPSSPRESMSCHERGTAANSPRSRARVKASATNNAMNKDRLNFLATKAIAKDTRWRWRGLALYKAGVGVTPCLQEGDMEYMVDINVVRQSQLVGDVAHKMDDWKRADPMGLEL